MRGIFEQRYSTEFNEIPFDIIFLQFSISICFKIIQFLFSFANIYFSQKQEITNNVKADPLQTSGGGGGGESLQDWLHCFKENILKWIIKFPKSLPFR